jgi:hypothetical protein
MENRDMVLIDGPTKGSMRLGGLKSLRLCSEIKLLTLSEVFII